MYHKNDCMNKEMKDTALKVTEYENEGKKRNPIVLIVCSAFGILSLLTNLIMNMTEMPDTCMSGFLKGLIVAAVLAAMALGIVYATGTLAKLYSFKKRLPTKVKQQYRSVFVWTDKNAAVQNTDRIDSRRIL